MAAWGGLEESGDGGLNFDIAQKIGDPDDNNGDSNYIKTYCFVCLLIVAV